MFKDKEFIGKLMKLALPIAFQSLMLALVAAADAFMLGRVEQNAMAAVSLATQIQFVQNMIITALVSATAVLGAQYWGKGDLKAVDRIFGITMKICGITSIVFFVGCVFFPRFLMLIFTNEEVLITIGIRYLKIAGWSYLLTGISQSYLTIMKISEHADMTAKISSTAVVLNIILNAILIFGLIGITPLGVQGAAIATLIARVVELLLAIGVSFKAGFIRFNISTLFTVDKLLEMDFIKCMLPLVGAGLLWSVGFTSYSAFMGHLGTDATAANSVASVIRDLLCCLCNGLASGGGILVGNELGAGKLDLGKKYGDNLLVISYACGFLCTAIMLAITPVVSKFVKLTDQASYYLTGMMIIMAFYMIGRTVNTIVINGIFAAGGDTIFDMYSLAVSMWCIAVPLAAIGTFWLHWPVFVVYACTCLDEVGKIPWVMLHYKKGIWVKDLTR